jgi:hypothetical protein
MIKARVAVGPPIHVAVMKKDGPKIYSEKRVAEFQKRSEEISEFLRRQFLVEAPALREETPLQKPGDRPSEN